MNRPVHPDDDVRRTVSSAGVPADPVFTAELRARLAAVASGDIELTTVRTARRRWLPIAAAAAVVALVAGAVTLVARDGGPDVVSDDGVAALVGSTWVALDADVAGDLPTLQMKVGATRPDVIIVNGSDGCNGYSGEFRLASTTVADARVANTSAGCAGPNPVVMPREGVTITVVGASMTLSDGETSTAYTAIESLAPVTGDGLDGVWRSASADAVVFEIADGHVVTTLTDFGVDIALERSLAVGQAEAWAYGDSLIVRTLATGFRRLDPIAYSTPPPVSTSAPATTATTASTVANPVVTTGPLDGAEEALITGTVGLIRGCLVVGTNETLFALVWQPGTTWDVAAEAAVLPDGTRVASGDFIEAGGGYHAPADVVRFGVSEDDAARLAACVDGIEVAVIQSPVRVIPAEEDGAADDERTVREYLTHAASGRYGEAGALLVSGALESERRSDLRPLMRDGLGLEDLGSALEVWCASAAICSEPSDVVPAGDFVLAAVFADGDRTLTGYFRGGSYEGVPEVQGLPPRRPPAGDVVACPTADVTGWLEADIDGDGAPETIVTTQLGDGHEINACNTSLVVTAEVRAGVIDPFIVASLDPEGDGRDALLVGTVTDGDLALEVLELVDGRLTGSGAEVRTDTSEDGSGVSYGCATVDGDRRLVSYEYRFVGGTFVGDSTAMDVTVRPPGSDTILDEYRLELPAESDAAMRIIDVNCDGQPIMTG